MHFIIGFFIFSIIYNYSLSYSKNRNCFLWVLAGIFLPIVSGLVLWSLPKREHSVAQSHKEKAQMPPLDERGTKQLASSVQQNPARAEEIINESNKENASFQEKMDNSSFKESSSKSLFYIKGSKKPLFIDVETTGLHNNDSIVSIGMFLLYAEESEEKQKFRYSSLHYIFDPCKKSHPIAEKAHGYDDWTLRHQELFEQKSHEILELIKESDLIVAHNVKFDIKFLRNAFSRIGIDIGQLDTACTMEMHGGSLAVCTDTIGINRKNSRHDAAEDAAMCMCLYLSSMSNINVVELYKKLIIPPAKNYIVPPPQPVGPLPRRNNIKKRNEILAGN
ncbi:3'-5' exonuclease [Acetobacter persici]|uniref:3'-5' exonuclease n=1 Tax=Acetobacter persici TaxID=1076596 RepID=UPI000A3D5DEB|nr:3'-5' exonuclease [Acetobacter persici]